MACDRVLVTGQFAGTVDFDPSANTDAKTSAGGLDLFVTRLATKFGEIPYPIQYDGTFRIGGTYDEVGSTIAIEGLRTQRLAHGGWFGAPNAPNGYTVDFDPGAGIANRSGSGNADAFVSSFLPTLPVAEPKTAITLTIDNSFSINDNPDYQLMMARLEEALGNPAIVPQDQKVAINAVMFDFLDWVAGAPSSTTTSAAQILPWTVITASNAHLFARRLANQARHTGGAGTPILEGLHEAIDSQAGDRLSACYRSILVLCDGLNYNDPVDELFYLRNARDQVLSFNDPDVNVHQINAVGVRGDGVQEDNFLRAFTNPPSPPGCTPLPSRQYFPSGPDQFPGYLVRSDATVPQVPQQGWGLGLALHTDGVAGNPQPKFAHPTYAQALSLMLKRCTRCPGDFNRDGEVNMTDMILFNAAHAADDPYADWNMDGGLFANECVINMDDIHTFNVAHALGCSCP